MPAIEPQPTFDALAVLTLAGAARDAFVAALDGDVDVDAALVADVIRASGRVTATAARRRELTVLCGLVRAIDAQVAGRIALGELASGLQAHAAMSERFEHFGEARVLLRTLAEVLEPGRGDGPGVRSQVRLLHDDLLALLQAELTGRAARSGSGPVQAAPSKPAMPVDPVAAWRVVDPARRASLACMARELVEGPAGYPWATGVAATAWQRGFSAVPVPGSRIGEDAAELARLVGWLQVSNRGELVEVALVPPPRWRIDAALQVQVLDRTLPSLAIPATATDLEVALQRDPRPRAVFTDGAGTFALLEADEYHVLAGPRDAVEAIGGGSVHELLAHFRDFVESLAVDGEPPEDLLEVARRFGRLSRRGSASRDHG